MKFTTATTSKTQSEVFWDYGEVTEGLVVLPGLEVELQRWWVCIIFIGFLIK